MVTRWVNGGGGNRPTVSRDTGRQSWEELMMGRNRAETSGPICSNHRQGEQQLSHASSNRTQERQAMEAQGLNPLGRQNCVEEQERVHTSIRSSGSMNSTFPPQAQPVDIPSPASKSRPSTILFDLNADPDLEEGEVQQDVSPCGLSLNLALRTVIDQAPNPVQTLSETGDGDTSEGLTDPLREITLEDHQKESMLQFSSDLRCPVGGRGHAGDGTGTETAIIPNRSTVIKRRAGRGLVGVSNKRRRPNSKDESRSQGGTTSSQGPLSISGPPNAGRREARDHK